MATATKRNEKSDSLPSILVIAIASYHQVREKNAFDDVRGRVGDCGAGRCCSCFLL